MPSSSLTGPPPRSLDLTADITATFSLPPEAYTPRLAEYLLLPVEATVEANLRDKRHGRGFLVAYSVAETSTREGLR